MSRRLSFSHPNRKRLQAWLDAPEALADDADEFAAITRHVESCERCAARLEALALDDDLDAPPDPELAAAIRDIYEPPADLTDRVVTRVAERERADREVSLFLGLFGIAKDAVELFLPPAEGGPAPTPVKELADAETRTDIDPTDESGRIDDPDLTDEPDRED